MVDLAFLLVTFFMLTTKFRPDEPVIVDQPSSVSQIPLPDKGVLMLTIDGKGRVAQIVSEDADEANNGGLTGLSMKMKKSGFQCFLQ